MDGLVGGGEHFGDASGEAFHKSEGGVGAEAIAFVGIEGIDGADQGEVAVADQFHEREAGAEVLAGDADDEAEIGAGRSVFDAGDAAADFLEAMEIAGEGELRARFAAGR